MPPRRPRPAASLPASNHYVAHASCGGSVDPGDVVARLLAVVPPEVAVHVRETINVTVRTRHVQQLKVGVPRREVGPQVVREGVRGLVPRNRAGLAVRAPVVLPM